MKVLLVGNYEFDGAMSMKIWADALLRELLQLGIDAKLIAPKPVWGRIKPSATGLGKWLGYIDRFLLFPRDLHGAAAKADVVHICDHGGAMYVFGLKGKPVLVTCHDMLAVRGALGEVPEMRASLLGNLLQLWIRKGVRRADCVACVSQYTYRDVRRILKEDRHLCVIQNGLNYPFHPLPSDEVDGRLAGLQGVNRPFILHVGSGHVRKNRDGVLRIFAKAAQQKSLQMVFAGEPLGQDMLRLARDLRIIEQIVQVVVPDVKIIEALYNRAIALLFPSRYEGFGWPTIEAQACGCPVVASNIPPFVEVLGQSAIVKPLEDETGMAESIRRLAEDKEYREEVRQRGFDNVRSHFETARMMNEYLSVYRELAGRREQ
jgi:glycosyltransferase involved in cell wall biosynthesis